MWHQFKIFSSKHLYDVHQFIYQTHNYNKSCSLFSPTWSEINETPFWAQEIFASKFSLFRIWTIHTNMFVFFTLFIAMCILLLLFVDQTLVWNQVRVKSQTIFIFIICNKLRKRKFEITSKIWTLRSNRNTSCLKSKTFEKMISQTKME